MESPCESSAIVVGEEDQPSSFSSSTQTKQDFSSALSLISNVSSMIMRRTKKGRNLRSKQNKFRLLGQSAKYLDSLRVVGTVADSSARRF